MHSCHRLVTTPTLLKYTSFQCNVKAPGLDIVPTQVDVFIVVFRVWVWVRHLFVVVVSSLTPSLYLRVNWILPTHTVIQRPMYPMPTQDLSLKLVAVV